MNKIRIGTRDSQLALYQANLVKDKLFVLGVESELVLLKSAGDLDQKTPLNKIGFTGVFTKRLDQALYNNEIDIAVHSLKDLPTVSPEGIEQIAILERATPTDVLVLKNGVDECSAHSTIATGSIRRSAQWLHRFPSHKTEGIRGNVPTRIQKLNASLCDGLILAKAGIHRLEITSNQYIDLEWMVPAPGQGAIGVTALTTFNLTANIRKILNHSDSEICTQIERRFLNLLEGGCSAPIGALAEIKQQTIYFKGRLNSLDGKQQVEVTRDFPLEDANQIAAWAVDQIKINGGQKILDQLKRSAHTATIYSTKKLHKSQIELFPPSLQLLANDFIKIEALDFDLSTVDFQLPLIISSKNAIQVVLEKAPHFFEKFTTIYCVGEKTKNALSTLTQANIHVENNAKKLADFVIKNKSEHSLTFISGQQRLSTLPQLLTANGIKINEIHVYKTILSPIAIEAAHEAVLFFSPSAVKSYYVLNNIKNKIAFCIGETTAKEARKHFDNVHFPKDPSIEGVLQLVKSHYD